MSDSESRPGENGRWALIGQVLRFQVKLLVDGLRDLIMSPVSLVAALIGLLVHPTQPGRLFGQVLDFGRKTEEWINLFDREQPEPGIDELFSHLEQRLETQYRDGGVTRTAKQTVDASLNGLQRALRVVRQQQGTDGPAQQEDQQETGPQKNSPPAD